MNKAIDILQCLLLVAIFVVLVNQTTRAPPLPAQSEIPASEPIQTTQPPGRFQISITHFPGDGGYTIECPIMTDTVDGKTWRLHFRGKIEPKMSDFEKMNPVYWEEIPIATFTSQTKRQ